MPEYRIGIDVGGTFTDFLFLDGEGNQTILKSPTTPGDPSEGVFAGMNSFAGERGIGLEELLRDTVRIVHGTTITTNAVLTGAGAMVGFLTTEGFRDNLIMRRGLSESRYNWKTEPPPPLVPRRLIATAKGRIDVNGDELEPLAEEDVLSAARRFKEAGVEAVAVCFLWSFANQSHEARAAEILRAELGDIYLSLSSEVLPQIRLYERNSTTALNAYVGPPLAKYLGDLDTRLREADFSGSLLVMQSNGGVMAPDIASRFAVNTLLSGPAAAPVAAIHYGAAHGCENLISVDMGGTSFDVAMIRGKIPSTTRESQVRGYHVGVPMLDIHTIGAGGGSIAWVDTGGVLQVGPKSAGADPGPACYGRGGTQPTVTDACLVLGLLEADTFAGGAMPLDAEAAADAIQKHVAEPLGLSAVEAAYGVFRIVNARMADAVRVMSVQRGDDPRDFAMIVAGGAGPMHAAPIAAELSVSQVLIPRESSVFCAAGMLLTDLKHSYVRTFSSDLDKIDDAALGALLRAMSEEALATLENEGVGGDRVELGYSAELRYIGQFNEVEVPAFEGGSVSDTSKSAMVDAFHQRHDALFGYAIPGAEIELINIHLTATGSTEKPALTRHAAADGDAQQARTGQRKACLNGQFEPADVYDALKLEPGARLTGPAIVEQPTTTIVVPGGHELRCDQYGHFVLQRQEDTS